MTIEPKRSRWTPQSLDAWLGLAPRLVGIVGLLASLIFWMVTAIVDPPGRVSPEFVTGFFGLLAVGQGAETLRQLRSPLPDPEQHSEGESSSGPP